MQNRIDTPERRQAVLEHLEKYGAVTYRVAVRLTLTTPQAYRLLRRMQDDGLVRQDDRDPGFWRVKTQPDGHTT